MKNCTRKVKYTSLVRPVVEYSSPVWNPSKKQQISQVEQIQRKAAWYVFNDYRDRSTGAVTNMIDTLQWDSLACKRTKASLILLYKINGGLVEVPTTMISQSDRRTRGAHKFRQIQSNKDFYKFSFFPNTISVWNSLPQSIALSPLFKTDRKTSGQIWQTYYLSFIHVHVLCQILVTVRLPGTSVLNKIPQK